MFIQSLLTIVSIGFNKRSRGSSRVLQIRRQSRNFTQSWGNFSVGAVAQLDESAAFRKRG